MAEYWNLEITNKFRRSSQQWFEGSEYCLFILSDIVWHIYLFFMYVMHCTLVFNVYNSTEVFSIISKITKFLEQEGVLVYKQIWVYRQTKRQIYLKNIWRNLFIFYLVKWEGIISNGSDAWSGGGVL